MKIASRWSTWSSRKSFREFQIGAVERHKGMSDRPGTSVVPWLPTSIREALRILQAPNSTQLERVLCASLIDAAVRRVIERTPEVPAHWLALLVNAIESPRRGQERHATSAEDGSEASI
jgi:hypothetical protein